MNGTTLSKLRCSSTGCTLSFSRALVVVMSRGQPGVRQVFGGFCLDTHVEEHPLQI